MAEETAVVQQPAAKGKSSAPFILSLIGGIFILINGVLIAALGGIITAMSSAVPGMEGILGATGIVMAVVGLALGVLVIVGTVLMRNPAKAKMGAILVIVFSLISLVIGGGFLIGTILGVIGGALGLKK
jgi:hypothetical protein